MIIEKGFVIHEEKEEEGRGEDVEQFTHAIPRDRRRAGERPPRNKNQEKEAKRTHGEIRVLLIVSASSQVKDKH